MSAGRGSAPVVARRVPRPAGRAVYPSRSAVGTPGFSASQYPAPSSRSAQFPQYPSQPSPYSEKSSPHSRHVAMPEIVGPNVIPGLFELSDGPMPRRDAEEIICASHYLRSFPSGWAYCYHHGGAVVVFSIPANKNLGTYLFSGTVEVRELARLWAPDGHAPNLLTGAMAAACRSLRSDTGCEAVISFADPNQGHHGGVYQAASWLYTGQSEETRVYRTSDGRTLSRRSFHSGSTSLPPSLEPMRLEGKHRYVKCLTRTSRRLLRQPIKAYPKSQAVAA